MATVNLFRGGTPDFKPAFCKGDWAEWMPPFNAHHYKDTPPFDSHADAAHGQGFLNLQFPLIPNLAGNWSHHWMQTALKNLSAVGDRIYLAWVPLRSFVLSQYIEVSAVDPLLSGVYFKPVAARVSWNFTTQQWEWKDNTTYSAAVTASGVTEFPMGTPAPAAVPQTLVAMQAEGDDGGGDDGSGGDGGGDGGDDDTPTTETEDALYGFINLYDVSKGTPPCTFGHNLVKTDAEGKPTGGLDSYYGGVVLGYEITQGTADKIQQIYRSNIAVYMSAKLLAFEGSTQIG